MASVTFAVKKWSNSHIWLPVGDHETNQERVVLKATKGFKALRLSQGRNRVKTGIRPVQV